MTENKLIHIVDDDDAFRRSLSFLLRTAGYEVARWQDGVSFLKGADKAVPACVVLDVCMSGLDGLQVQAEMRREGFAFPLIIVTGHGDLGLATRAMKGGAIDFMEKPFDREALLGSVETAFRQLDDQSAQIEMSDWAKAELGKLTRREREVLDGLACGYPNKSIAFDLEISTCAVEVYRANVMTKLGVHNFADALRIAFAAGLGSDQAWHLNHGKRDAELPGLLQSTAGTVR